MPTRQLYYLLVAAATVAIAAFGPAPVPQAQTPAAPPPAGQAPPRGGGQGQRGAQTIPPPAARGRGVQGAPALDDPANANADFSSRPPVVALTPEEEAKRFWLPAGYRMEPVLVRSRHPGSRADRVRRQRPHVRRRAARLHADAGRHDRARPEGRISLHEDRDSDGVYEHHTVFVDKLVFPRFVTAVRRQQRS